jgi:uncharacterized protein (DUF111 family)
MADYDKELSEIESEVDHLTRQVSGYVFEPLAAAGCAGFLV